MSARQDSARENSAPKDDLLRELRQAAARQGLALSPAEARELLPAYRDLRAALSHLPHPPVPCPPALDFSPTGDAR